MNRCVEFSTEIEIGYFGEVTKKNFEEYEKWHSEQIAMIVEHLIEHPMAIVNRRGSRIVIAKNAIGFVLLHMDSSDKLIAQNHKILPEQVASLIFMEGESISFYNESC